MPSDETSSDEIVAAQAALGRALRELRGRAALTQKELAARSQADDTYISQVEGGHRDIRWSTITRLLAALDATFVDLAAAIESKRRQRLDEGTTKPNRRRGHDDRPSR
ncbi:MAG: helix-turn-helix domain-containing protein [Solirubrobacteraceae bacterium]